MHIGRLVLHCVNCHCPKIQLEPDGELALFVVAWRAGEGEHGGQGMAICDRETVRGLFGRVYKGCLDSSKSRQNDAMYKLGGYVMVFFGALGFNADMCP